jgi:hypothetical protein
MRSNLGVECKNVSDNKYGGHQNYHLNDCNVLDQVFDMAQQWRIGANKVANNCQHLYI